MAALLPGADPSFVLDWVTRDAAESALASVLQSLPWFKGGMKAMAPLADLLLAETLAGTAPARSVDAIATRMGNAIMGELRDAVWYTSWNDQGVPNDVTEPGSCIARNNRRSIAAMGPRLRKNFAQREAARLRTGLQAGCELDVAETQRLGAARWRDGAPCPGSTSREVGDLGSEAAAVDMGAWHASRLVGTIPEGAGAAAAQLVLTAADGTRGWWCGEVPAWRGPAEGRGAPCPATLVLQGQLKDDPAIVDPFEALDHQVWGPYEHLESVWRRNVVAAAVDALAAGSTVRNDIFEVPMRPDLARAANGTRISELRKPVWVVNSMNERAAVWRRRGHAMSLSPRWLGIPSSTSGAPAADILNASILGAAELARDAAGSSPHLGDLMSVADSLHKWAAIHPLLEPSVSFEPELRSMIMPHMVVRSVAHWCRASATNAFRPGFAAGESVRFSVSFPEFTMQAFLVYGASLQSEGRSVESALSQAASMTWLPWSSIGATNLGVGMMANYDSVRAAGPLNWAQAMGRAGIGFRENTGHGFEVDDELAKAPLAARFLTSLTLRQMGAGTAWSVMQSPIPPVWVRMGADGMGRAVAAAGEAGAVRIDVDDITAPRVAGGSVDHVGSPRAWQPLADEMLAGGRPGSWPWLFPSPGGLTSPRSVADGLGREPGCPAEPLFRLSHSGAQQHANACDWDTCTKEGRTGAKLLESLIAVLSEGDPAEPGPGGGSGGADLSVRVRRLVGAMASPVDGVCQADALKALTTVGGNRVDDIVSHLESVVGPIAAAIRALATKLGWQGTVPDACGVAGPRDLSQQPLVSLLAAASVAARGTDGEEGRMFALARIHAAHIGLATTRVATGDVVAAQWHAARSAELSTAQGPLPTACIAVVEVIVSNREDMAMARATVAACFAAIARARAARQAATLAVRAVLADPSLPAEERAALADFEQSLMTGAVTGDEAFRMPFYLSYHGRAKGSSILHRGFAALAWPDDIVVAAATARLRALQAGVEAQARGTAAPPARLLRGDTAVKALTPEAVVAARGQCALRPGVARTHLLAGDDIVTVANRPDCDDPEHMRLAGVTFDRRLSRGWWQQSHPLASGRPCRGQAECSLFTTAGRLAAKTAHLQPPALEPASALWDPDAQGRSALAWAPLPRPLSDAERSALAAGRDPCVAMGLRRPRVAFVSSFFTKEHPHGHVLRGAVEGLDRSLFDVVLVRLNTLGAAADREIIDIADAVADVRRITARAALPALQALGLDVIVFSDQLTQNLMFQLGAQRSAPLQVLFGGDPTTSGHTNSMDFFVGGDRTEGDGADAQQPTGGFDPEQSAGAAVYAEQLLRLRGQGFSYSPKPTSTDRWAPRNYTLLGLPEGGGDGINSPVLIGCLQSSFKISPFVDDVLSAVVRALPQARIVFLSARESTWQARLERRWRTVFPDVLDRVLVLPRTPPGRQFAEIFSSMDVMLHPVPFGGSRTAADAVASAIPFVTMPTRAVSGRMARALLISMGMEGLLAESPSHAVRMLLRLATSPSTRRTVSDEMVARADLVWSRSEVALRWQNFLANAVGMPAAERRWLREKLEAEDASVAARLRAFGPSRTNSLMRVDSGAADVSEAARWGNSTATRLAAEHTLFAAGPPVSAVWE